MGQSRRPRPKLLARKLCQIRERLGLSQQQMAAALGGIESPPQPGHVSEFERGVREPSLLYLLAVSRMAGVPMEVLVDDDLDVPSKLPRRQKSKESAGRVTAQPKRKPQA